MAVARSRCWTSATICEKVALYFAWVEHYTNWLMYRRRRDHFFRAVESRGLTTDERLARSVCLLVVVWAVAMTDRKRHNAALNLRWGTTDFDVHEQPRPEFRGELRQPYCDKPEMYHPNVRQQRKRVAISLACCSCCAQARTVTLFVG